MLLVVRCSSLLLVGCCLLSVEVGWCCSLRAVRCLSLLFVACLLLLVVDGSLCFVVICCVLIVVGCWCARCLLFGVWCVLMPVVRG